jgi:uncharacterized membrane protein
MPHLRNIWIRIRSSLWFLPLGMVFVSILLAMLLITADVTIGTEWAMQRSLVFGVGASGARGMLSAIAGSMMTVASLTFALTISTLATASSQYTSRLIRNFMGDRLNQFVLGYFVGLFAYCLVVLRTVRDGDAEAFVPPLAVMGGLLLALASIGVLILFIHHIAESIQVGVILRRVTSQTLNAVERLFPAGVGEPAAGAAAAPGSTASDAQADDRARGGVRWHEVPAGRFGYVQSLDAEGLLALAAEVDGVIRLCADVGWFVTPAGTLCEIASASPPGEQLLNEVRDTFDVSAARSIEQDAAYGMRQIVDIALKALSPGINDTTTAVMCVEHLGAVLERLAARDIPDRMRAEDGQVRLIASGRSFDALTGLCLDQIRQSASGNPAVMLAILRAIESAARQTSDPARRRTLLRHARLISDLARESVSCEHDVGPVTTAAKAVMDEIGA